MAVPYSSVRNKRVLYHLNEPDTVRSSDTPVSRKGDANMEEYPHFVMDGNGKGILLFSE
jgi:hypothetical protein